MPQPDRNSKNSATHYMLDLNPVAKARVYFLSASAGSIAAVTTKIIGGLLLPEAAAIILCWPAFVEAAEYAASHTVRPQDLVVREMRPPRFEF